MRSINKVILIGNLTRDPEMRQTPNGQYVTTFGIATNRDWVTADGERKGSAEFHEVVAWTKLAEICNQFLRKGDLVYAEGYLKTRSWDTPEGTKRFKTEVVIHDMIRLEKRAANIGVGDIEPQRVSEEIEEPAALFEEEVSATPAAPREAKSIRRKIAVTSSEDKTPPREIKSPSTVGIDTDLGL